MLTHHRLVFTRTLGRLSGGSEYCKFKMQTQAVLKLLLISLIALQAVHRGHGARILAAFIFPGRSHFMMINAIIRELISRGHEVTFITPFSLAKENLGTNLTEVVIPQLDFWDDFKRVTKKTSVVEMSDVPVLQFIKLCTEMGVKSTEFAFQQPAVKALIDEKNKIGKYDLLLAEEFYNEAALIFGHLYQIPIVTVSTFGYSNYMSPRVGVISPWSYVPHLYMRFTDEMSFLERITNIYVSGGEAFYRNFFFYPAQDELLRKYFSHLPGGVPTVNELNQNVSALLLNNYVPIISARATSFNMIPVGGLHIQPPKALPTRIEKFLNEAKYGAIYFSLGTQVRSAEMSAEKLNVFLNVFGSLKQRVLWKFEDDRLTNLPANVIVEKWMPQNDILAHRNVKVFITHGGLFGTQEAVHYGVPMLGMPVYADQHHNIYMAKANGYALSLDYRSITEEDLKASLLELLENPKYQTNMKRASSIFRDRPLSAMDTAMYWIDYVIKHRGAPHLIAAGSKLPWYQYYLVDVIGLALFLLFVPIFIIYKLIAKKAVKTKKVKKN